MAREFRSCLYVMWVACLLANAICAPSPASLPRRVQYRPYRDVFDEDSNDLVVSASQKGSTSDPFDDDDDDDDDDFGTMQTSSGGGSSIFSLLNLVTALFPTSSSTGNRAAIKNMIRQYLLRKPQVNIRRKSVADNVIDVDYVKNLTPPFQRQEDEDDDSHSADDDDDDDDDDDSESEESNDAAEESVENDKDEGNARASKQDTSSKDGSEDDNGSDYDEPEGDGQGGGILGLLAGLSGGDEGSDLGTLLATVSQIVGNLSGDGFDLNALLTSAFGLFVGLLSQGDENPGEVISTYLLTSLDTITGGGAQNNGAFFGNFLSTLLKGVSAAEGESGESSEEGNGKVKMADSAGFFMSLLMSLSGDMSKGSSGGSSQPW